MSRTSPAAALHADVSARLSGTPSLLMFDIDGTLSPIAPRPEEAHVPRETLASLRALRHRGHHLAFVSGRSVGDIRRMVPVPDTWAIGNHGMEIADPAGTVAADPRVAPHADQVTRAAEDLVGLVSQVPGAFVEDKGLTLSVHYRLSAPDARETLLGHVQRIAADRGLRVSEGKKVIELRPPVDVNKGTAVVDLANRLVGTDQRATLLFAGDDRTDEDAFVALRKAHSRAVTIRVGAAGEATSAEFRLDSPEELGALLELLASRV